MIRSVKEKLTDFFNKGQERTILTKKNIAASFGIKGLTILISMILVPMTISYVNPERNGIWLTLYSMVVWLNLFDIGLGNGMKNKVAEAKAKGDNELARKYISSTYAIVGLICCAIFILFCLINPYIDWLGILKTIPLQYAEETLALIRIFIISFCCMFILNLLKFIVMADQRPAIASFLDMLGQILVLTGIFVLSKTVVPSLVYLGLITAFAPVLVFIIASFYLFNTRYKEWRPSIKCVDFRIAGNTMSLGIKFFIATCASFMVTQTLPFLITRMVNPAEVTNFNAAFRLFSVLFNIMAIIIIPFWSSFTDAYALQDRQWMKKTIKMLHRIFVYFLIFQLIVLILSPVLYYVWINYWMPESTTLDISFTLSLVVCVYVSILCWLNIHIYPLNGIGKVNLQVISSVFEMILLIPAALFLGHRFGTPGIILAPILVYIPRSIWAPIQLNKLINRSAKGIWNK